ncbi:manganese transport protein [Asanoa ferruginea]|uniref:Manganese transport protein n=1 Tax=Asanoa ferruginea TaxID=53367 RepID=A0A3D9ZX40_9ACTN|nr:Nramp family divalent metal transporter [Asanoa ferruginea]REF98320.1 manganese transport protein [Asanoa ferruginea]
MVPAVTAARLGRITLLGPAFVAGIAYVDPGNFATNTAAGVDYGYLLLWVVVAANLAAILIQLLSAKLGIATGKSLPRLCRERFSRPVTLGLWVQAELVAIATDLAEILGGALALRLLFDLPVLVGGVVTAVVSLLLLSLRNLRHYERAVLALLAVIVVGFLCSLITARPSLPLAVHGLVPAFDGQASMVLAAGMLGATVMPHAIYLHSALVVDRFGDRLGDPASRHRLLRASRVDVLTAMTVAGGVNLAMLLVAAAALAGSGADSLDAVHAGLGSVLGSGTALLFALALLASGIASSSVGTYAGAVILEGFVGLRVHPLFRRLATLAPALVVLALGLEPTRALVLSQVVLSVGIPFALVPLILLTRDRRVMGALTNKRSTTATATVVAGLVSALNVVLIGSTVTGGM